MNKVTPLIKFAESFGLNPCSLKAENITESYFIEKGINVDEFKRLMIKNDLDEYTFILLYYIIEIYLAVKVDEAINTHIQSDNEREIARQYEIDLTKTLLFLLEDKTTFNMTVTFNKSINNITIKNEKIIMDIANQLYIEFKKHDFHKVPLTYEEAKAEMLSKEEFKNSVYVEQNFGSPDEPDIHEVEFDVAIEHYAENSKKEMDITIDFLKSKLKTIKTTKKKRGAKIKNSRLADLCEDLSFLKRIDRYLNQTETEYICDLTLTSDDCRFIYACLVFFNIIEDNSKIRSKTLPENHIRAILKQKKRDSWIEDDIYGAKLFNIFDLKDNLLKKSPNRG